MVAEGPALRARRDAPGGGTSARLNAARLNAYDRWLAAAGAWHLWTVCPPLAAPGPVSPAAARSVAAPLARSSTSAPDAGAPPWRSSTSALDAGVPRAASPRPARAPEVRELVAALVPLLERQGVFALLDLEPVTGVTVAARLSRLGLAHAVLVLPRWPYAEALLPTADLTRALLDMSRDLRQPHLDNVVFVLDAERARPLARPPGDRRADNRYRLSAADLPTLRDLRAHGVRTVHKIAGR